ncbi:MAG TPA: HXXEE domain-containing protein [Gammaproteobacteria bacterium]|nr:HXXEE domain-containing protein [Gammaproteobacteria bacterium]
MVNSLLFTVVLPVIFILHNIEEYVSFDPSAWSFYRFIGNEFYNRAVFFYALCLLSITVIVAVTLNYIYAGSLLHALVVITFFSIFINSLEHCAVSLWRRKILPGTISSVLLIIPFSLYALIVGHKDMFVGIQGALNYVFVSFIVMVVAVFLGLWSGFFIDKLMSYFKR